MNFTYTIKKYKGLCLFLTFPVSVGIFSCCSSNQTHSVTKAGDTSKKSLLFSVVSPSSNDIVRLGQSFNIKLKSTKNLVPDSVVVLENNKKVQGQKVSALEYTCTSIDKTCGRKNVEINVYYSDTLSESHRVSITKLPTEAPKELKYKVIRKLQHDPEAYTQGLIYYKGLLYESTGMPNRSSLRCIDPKTGEILRKRKLEPQYFGEGIALIGNEIFMLTYREHKGFVFNLSDFELIREFDMQTDEGWGLATDGKKLILTDGSAYVYYFAPEYFTLENQIEVCNNQRLVNNLNELELTPEGLYANVYGENYIVLIDLETGTVIKTLDLSAIYPDNIPKDMDHVLNGIAYDRNSKTFYVTGKEWPVMYEISILSN
jgi:glutaminyl-peptide cyclotransferase